MAERARRVVAAHRLDLARPRPSTRRRRAPSAATTTSTSAPGASGTQAPRRSPCRRRRPCGAARARALARVDRPAGSRSPAAAPARSARAARRRPAPRAPSQPAAVEHAVAGRWPSSGDARRARGRARRTRASRRSAPRPAPPCSSATSRPGQPASHGGRPQVGQRRRRRAPRAPPRRVLTRDSAPRAASAGTPARRDRAKFMTHAASRSLRPQLAERDALVQPRLRRQAEHALADHVAQDLLGAARGLQAGQVGDAARRSRLVVPARPGRARRRAARPPRSPR